VKGRVALALATAGFSGYFPIAPGTVGSAVGLAVWALARTGGAGLTMELVMAAALLLMGAWAATQAERHLGITDPGPVVIDEVMGMCVTMLAAPFTWPAALTGFFLFRVFDIVKPPPARQLEQCHGGWGIMLDDLAAGIYAWGALALLVWLLPAWLA
jgi:phosphatidylglycerophosphatase A